MSKMSIEKLVDTGKLKLIPVNQRKVIEAENVNKFYDTNGENINKIIIKFKNNKNINEVILEKYKNKPDIIIIDFNKIDKDNKNNNNHNNKNNTNILEINSIPVFPIVYDGVIYLTPILIEQLNGFSNIFLDKMSALNDFYNRIYYTLGVLITDISFKIDITSYESSGIKNCRVGFLKNNTVSKIESWMTKFIPTTDFGWFGFQNRLALDHVFDNYDINSVAELGVYMGKSSKYISNKNKNIDFYAFDRFDNLFLTDYITKELQPDDTNFFYKYMRFETFNSNLKDHCNVFSIKNDNYLSIDFLTKYSINVDMFYIDFCKDDALLIDFVNKIFKFYPKTIIIGDDLVHLSYSIQYLSKKYNVVKMETCYICTHETPLLNKNKLIEKSCELTKKYNQNDFNKVLTYENFYKHNYVVRQIEKKIDIDKILCYIAKIDIDPNYLVDENKNNIYHNIMKLYRKDNNDNYYMNLYNKLCSKYKDENLKNSANITPIEFKRFDNYFGL